MSIEGEICALVRGAKSKQQAVEIASVVFSRPVEFIHHTLKEYGLMAEDGTFREPLRMTGLAGEEITQMAKTNTEKRFVWRTASKERLEKLFREGKTLEEMAAAFNLDTTAIQKQLDRMGLHQPDADPAPPSGPAAQVPRGRDVIGTARAVVEEAKQHTHEAAEGMMNLNGRNSGLYALGRVRQALDELARLLDCGMGGQAK